MVTKGKGALKLARGKQPPAGINPKIYQNVYNYVENIITQKIFVNITNIIKNRTKIHLVV